MHEDCGESTPFLLRGRCGAAGVERYGAAGTGTGPQQAASAAAPGVIFSRERQPALMLTRARLRPLLLAVTAAVGVAVMVIAGGLISTSGQAGRSPQRGGASLAAAAPGESSSGGSQRAKEHAAGEVTEVTEVRVGGGRGVGPDERGGGKRSGGKWRSHTNRSPGVTANTESGDEGGEGAVGASTAKPNVFFFLIDDMGYGDIGYQSTDLSELTPNLDKLAAGGIKLTNYYTMTACTPARASIMTGRYPVRYGMQHAVIKPGSPWGLPGNEKILPQYMNEAGYESHMVGKWHLGSHKRSSLPNHRGFKSYLGYLHGIDTYYSHKNTESVFEGKYFFDLGYGNATGYHDVSQPSTEGVPCSDGWGGPTWDDDSRDSLDPADACYTGTYSTDVFVGRARQIVQSKTPFDEEPLFLYLAHQAVHAPTGPAPWDSFTPEEQEQLNAVREKTGSDERAQFAGVLKFLDKRIGAFVDMLEQEGWLENSVIVVASDNGACPSNGGTNYPLRGTKESVYEGGAKVPALVWSNSHLPSEVRGTEYDKLMHSTDWLPTFASMAGAGLKGSAGALDGVDQWAALKAKGLKETGTGDNSEDPRTEMLYNWDPFMLASTNGLRENRELPQGAFRSGDWKLLVNVWCSGYYSHDPAVIENDRLLDPVVTCGGAVECEDCVDSCQLSPETYAYGNKLFNLGDDPREEHDLFDQYPEIAKWLRKRAEEVAYSEWTGAQLLGVDTDSYDIWKENGWWMVPWEEILEVAQQQKR